MKTPPKYIRDNAKTFLLCKQYIREGNVGLAILAAKETENRKLTQRIQQYVGRIKTKLRG